MVMLRRSSRVVRSSSQPALALWRSAMSCENLPFMSTDTSRLPLSSVRWRARPLLPPVSCRLLRVSASDSRPPKRTSSRPPLPVPVVQVPFRRAICQVVSLSPVARVYGTVAPTGWSSSARLVPRVRTRFRKGCRSRPSPGPRRHCSRALANRPWRVPSVVLCTCWSRMMAPAALRATVRVSVTSSRPPWNSVADRL